MDCKIKNNKRRQNKPRSDFQKMDELSQLQVKLEINTFGEQSLKEEKLVEIVENCFCKKITQMKEEALQKASRMIQLLYQEKNELQKQLLNLKQVLEVKEATIVQLRELIQQQINKREEETPKRQLYPQGYGDKSTTMTNGLFFSFTNSKSRQLKSTNTLDGYVYDTRSILARSKEFEPWKGHENVIETLVQAMSLQEVSINEFRQLDKLVSIQVQRSQELNEGVELQKDEIQEELLLCESSQIVDSEGKLTIESESKIQYTSDLIKKYESTICRFRQYSAFLRASLCEATNFISKMGQFLTSVSCHSQTSLTSLTKILPKLKQSSASMLETHQQNNELRQIIDQLLKNIKIIRQNIIK